MAEIHHVGKNQMSILLPLKMLTETTDFEKTYSLEDEVRVSCVVVRLAVYSFFRYVIYFHYSWFIKNLTISCILQSFVD